MIQTINEQDERSALIFRKLLDTMARPGKIVKLEQTKAKNNRNDDHHLITEIAVSLLDQEVFFHIVEEGIAHEHVLLQQQWIKSCTMSRHQTIEQSDYILLNGLQVIDMRFVKRGNLEYPDESTTLLCQVEQLGYETTHRLETIKMTMEGPGIKHIQTCYVTGLAERNLHNWKLANAEYPLGIDLIFADLEGNMMCMPRSTIFTWEMI